jgi:regulator of RNase E activity RraA
VVAEGDGVIVVPRKLALDVAKYANRELAGDKVTRRKLYKEVGLKEDDTVR